MDNGHEILPADRMPRNDSPPAPLALVTQRAAPVEPRRVLFFGKNMARSRCTGGLVHALRMHGLDVKWLNLATLRRWLGSERALRWARATYRSYRPDFVFVFCRDLSVVLLDEFRAEVPVVLWVEEPLDDLDAPMMDYMRRADLVCLSNPAHCQTLAQHGVDGMIFQMSGFSPTFHYPLKKQEPKRDVVFIGGPGRNGQRAEFLAQVSRECATEIYGVGWEEYKLKYPWLQVRRPVKVRGFRQLCATSRIVLGLNQVNCDPHYFSNRTFLTLACRAFHLTHYVPGLEQVFENGKHLVWYHSAEECARLIHALRNEPERRQTIAQAGHELVLERHQYRHRITEVLRALREGVPAGNEAQVILHPAHRSRQLSVESSPAR